MGFKWLGTYNKSRFQMSVWMNWLWQTGSGKILHNNTRRSQAGRVWCAQVELVFPSEEPQAESLKCLGSSRSVIFWDNVPVSDSMRKEAVCVAILVGLDNWVTVWMMMPRLNCRRLAVDKAKRLNLHLWRVTSLLKDLLSLRLSHPRSLNISVTLLWAE